MSRHFITETLREPQADQFLTDRACRIRALRKRALADIIEIGRLLSECKVHCGHGNWLPWLGREFGWSADTAERYIQLDKLADQIPQIADYDIPVSGLYLLAAPSTPETAREEAIARAEAGERLKHAEVQSIIATHSRDAVLAAAATLGADESSRGNNTGVGMSAHAERGEDFYRTPACAVHALLGVESFSGPIWEPACGDGAIVNVLRSTGHEVIATDLRDRGCPDATGGVDFLKADRAPAGVDTILANPPYKLANEFVRHALTLAPRVVMLLRLLFIESAGRCDIIDGGQLRRFYPFVDRLPMVHREGWDGPRADSPSIQFAWFCWDRNYCGDIIVRRIWARPPAGGRP
jgi:hypothetical protein